MELKKITKNEYERAVRKKYTKLDGLLKEFQAMDDDYVEIKNYHWNSAMTGACALNNAARRYGVHSVSAKYSGGRLFLVRSGASVEL